MSFEKFHWTSPAGVEISLPHMNQIKAGILRRHRKEEPIDFVFSLLEEVGDEETLEKVDDLSSRDLNALVEKWQAEVKPGESSGSSK